MLGFVLTTFITALSLLVVDLTVPGVVIPTVGASILAAVSLGLVNGSIKPFIKLFSLPITVLSLGTFSLVINGFCFWFASLFVPGFTIHGLLGFVLGPIVLSAVSTFLTGYAMNKGWDQKLERSAARLNEAKNAALAFANKQRLAGSKLPQ